MKVTIGVHPRETHEVILTQRDNVSGRDIASETLAPGDIYERKLEANTDFSIKLGSRVADDPADDPFVHDHDGGDDTLSGGGSGETGLAAAGGEGATTAPNADLGHTDPRPALQPQPAGISGEGTNAETGEQFGSAVDANGADTQSGDTQTEDAGGDTASGNAGADDLGGDTGTGDLRDAEDSDVRDILVDLEGAPSVEKTADGRVQVATINKALAAKGFKPITAARRDELAGG